MPNHRDVPKSLIAFTVLMLLAGSPVPAVDGVIEINPVGARVGRITPGDAAGFPVTLSEPGHGRLTRPLVVDDESANGIEIGAGSSERVTNSLVTRNASWGILIDDATLPTAFTEIATTENALGGLHAPLQVLVGLATIADSIFSDGETAVGIKAVGCYVDGFTRICPP